MAQFADLARRMNTGSTTPSENVEQMLSEWMVKQRENSPVHQHLKFEGGYIESAYMLVGSQNSEWSIQDLRDSAISAKLPYSRWITPATDGVEIRVDPPTFPVPAKYWHISKNGKCYSSQLLLEDYESPSFNSGRDHPTKSLWFDLAIHRIANVLLDTAALYKQLDRAPDDSLFALNQAWWTPREGYLYLRSQILSLCYNSANKPSGVSRMA